MNKKYSIINTNPESTEFCADYFFYIVIFILIIYLVVLIVTRNYRDNNVSGIEKFEISNSVNQTSNNSSVNKTASSIPSNNTTSSIAMQMQTMPMMQNRQENLTNNSNITSANLTTSENTKPTIEQLLDQAKFKNIELSLSKEILEETLKKQKRALYLSKRYNKIVNSSLTDEIDFINIDFEDIQLPTSDFENKQLISTQKDLNDLISEVKEFKNIYKVGDIVTQKSDYNISKDNICYKDHSKFLKQDPNFQKKYPECMVCSVNPEQSYKDTKSWKNTKTNIKKICLFNPDSNSNSDILDYNGCAKMCKL